MVIGSYLFSRILGRFGRLGRGGWLGRFRSEWGGGYLLFALADEEDVADVLGHLGELLTCLDALIAYHDCEGFGLHEY